MIPWCGPAGLADEPASGAAAADPAESQTPQQAEAPADAGSATLAAPDSGDALLTEARSHLEGLESLSCDLHQTAIIAGMKLSAVGRYTEASGNRVRLNYQIFPMEKARVTDLKPGSPDAELAARDEADSKGILTQISDGTVLHTMWKNGETVRVTRRNIRDILAMALTVADYDPQNAAMDLGIGGLRGLIARLQTTMEFAAPKTVTIGDRTFLEVTGRWNSRIRNDVFKMPADVVTIPQPQIPEYARVYIDAETRLPRRIQYLKRNPDPTQKTVHPMLTLDLRNLALNQPVDDQLFAFQPPEGAVEEDLTQQVIRAIQQTAEPEQGAAPSSEEKPGNATPETPGKP